MVRMMQIDATGLFGSERDAFLDLLGDLSDQEWQLATECPEWTVKGVALHVLGDDLSLLARQRDGATDSLRLFAEGRPGLDVGDLLDGFNEQWVTAASFLGPQLVVELLALTGTWTERFYGSCDLDALGEPVGWFGATGPSPMWQAIARELIERWVHHHQILRAVGRPPLGGPVADMAERIALAGGAYRLADLGACDGRRGRGAHGIEVMDPLEDSGRMEPGRRPGERPSGSTGHRSERGRESADPWPEHGGVNDDLRRRR